MNPGIVSNLWLLPAVPFAAAIVILSFGKSRRKGAAVLAIGGQIVVLAISIAAFLPTLQTHGFRAVQNFTWFTFGEQTLRLGFVLDPLAAAMLVMISLVGLCIFVFSVGYMADDKNFSRFFAYLSFFDQHPDFVELLIQERAVFKRRKTPTYFEHRERNVGRWQALYRELMDAGRVRRMLPDEITDVMSSALYGTMFTNFFAGRAKSLETQARQIIDVVFRGILSEEERARERER